MPDRTTASTPYRAVVFLATAFTLAVCIFLIDNNLFSQPEQFHESDFIMTFHVAGRLVSEGRASELYPNPSAKTFVNSRFDKAAHEYLPTLPKDSTGAYMYIPLVAGFFAPFGGLDPNLSLLLWQAISALALLWCCRELAALTGAKTGEMFFLAFLFLPIFLTLWAGQLGLTFGLLPLCLGFSLLVKNRPLLAGVIWSILLLKPQYFLAAAFVSLVLLVSGRYWTFIGMSSGVIGLLVVTLLGFGPNLTQQWLLSHQVSDAMYSSGQQGIPSHLITGLPANLMILFPVAQRAALKWPLYFGAAMLWVVGFCYAIKIAKGRLDNVSGLAIALTIGICLSAITLPHLLYYDLCVLVPAGALLLTKSGPWAGRKELRWLAILGWLCVSGFLAPMLAFANIKLIPLLLEIILTGLFFVLLRKLGQISRPIAGRSYARIKL
ncbi:MAG: glycosyltransferase family 87 protein [Candidatus Binatia bacterium]